MRFKFLNLNPLNRREKDCVCRAISLGLDEDYEVIKHKLELIADLFDCEMLCVDCYKHLLDSVYELERIEAFHGMTINEFCELEIDGIYIIRVEGHATCVIDSCICDTWNCGEEIIDMMWRVE